MADISPEELKGNWVQGYALDKHTVSSDYLGDDEYGHPHFDTKRSPLGQLLYRLKFQSDKSVLSGIIETVCDFLSNTWKITSVLHLLIPVPPSKLSRSFQPVIEIARQVGSELGLPVSCDSLVKIRETPELKEVDDPEEREAILNNAFQTNNDAIKDKNILLFDDLFRSGVTLNTAAGKLYAGGASKVYVLALTKTRTKR